jgi:hypothetical protein
MKLFTLVFSIFLLCTFHEIREKKEETLILGTWKVSGLFCSERDEVPKGFSFTFLENGKGYLEHKKVKVKEVFIWHTNSDTLQLKFERENEVKNVLFKKDKFLVRKLPYHKKHIELRYLDFKECGVELEFIQ